VKGALLSALVLLESTFVGLIPKKMEERSALCNLASYVNVNGDEAVNRRVVEETTRLEGLEDRGEEWHLDVLMLRRFHRFPLDRQGVHVFTRFYWSIMANQKNLLRHHWQKEVLGKMLTKVLIPFAYKNRVWCLDESLWPTSMQEFEGLNHQLPLKFPEIHASRQWQAIVRYYNDIRQELETQNE